mgnify:CR=1 FL=1
MAVNKETKWFCSIVTSDLLEFSAVWGEGIPVILKLSSMHMPIPTDQLKGFTNANFGFLN